MKSSSDDMAKMAEPKWLQEERGEDEEKDAQRGMRMSWSCRAPSAANQRLPRSAPSSIIISTDGPQDCFKKFPEVPKDAPRYPQGAPRT
eukprot:1767615-Pyramimonas_sp.AAC.1